MFVYVHIKSPRCLALFIVNVSNTSSEALTVRDVLFQVDQVITMANKMENNGKLGNYRIRERTKV